MNVLLRTNDMKNSLPERNEKKGSDQISCLDRNASNKCINHINPPNQRIVFGRLLSALIFLFAFSPVSAQTVESIDNYIKNISSDEAQQLDDLIQGSNSTLFIYDNEFEIDGNSSPVIADVEIDLLDQLNNPNANFEDIELIRIKVRNSNDLKYKLDTGNLSHFKKLKYIYVLVTFDICPENQNNIDCQKSEISKMISLPAGDNSLVVLFEVVNLM